MQHTIYPPRLLLSLGLSLGLVLSSAAQPAPTDESRFLHDVSPLTLAGKRSGEGYFSADGRSLVFQSERDASDPFYQIYRMDLASGKTARISTGAGKTTCSWIHPDGRRVLFASTHADPETPRLQKEEFELRQSGKARRYSWDFDEHYDIYQSSPGAPLRNLTHTRGYDAEGSYSPDGKWIAFASNRHAFTEKLSPKEQALFDKDASSQMEIYLMRSDGSQVKRLTHNPGYDGGPFFSKDGRFLCWRRFSLDGSTAEVFTMDLATGAEKPLTHLKVMSWAPYFHPSGDYLIFTTNLQGHANFELYIVDAQGLHEPVRITSTDGFDGLPVFSPDGQRLAWTSSRLGPAQICWADWNDAAARKALGLAPKASAQRPSQPSQPATASLQSLRKTVERLAGPEMDGRLTGSAGEQAAADFIAARLRSLGLEPAGDKGSYLQSFEFTAGVSLGADNSLLANGQPLALSQQWLPLSFSSSGPSPESGVVFAGYGLEAPQTKEQAAYDSYAGMDVKDRWVLVLRFWPEHADPARRQYLSQFANLAAKARQASKRGARGLIVVNGPLSQSRTELVPLNLDAGALGGGLPAVTVSNAVAESWMAGKLASAQRDLDDEKPVPGWSIEGLSVRAGISLKQERRQGHNVLARLKGSQRKHTLVIGAHYDHLGHGETSNSLARADEQGQVHYGADDNASGVAAVLEVAGLLTHSSRPKDDVIFALWSGEELGILGSSHYCRTAPAAAAYLNLDMVGRLRQRLLVQGTATSSGWPLWMEQANLSIGLPVALSEEAFLPTDSTAFVVKQVPALNFFTGSHSEYHSPRDRPNTLDYAGLEKITRLVARLATMVANQPPMTFVAPQGAPAGGSRSGIRAYLGTVPDYAGATRPGVLLSGVSKGSPAEKAGLQAGDLITGLNGRGISGLQDYMQVLEALEVGKTIEVVVERAGQTVRLPITPGSRQ